MTLYATLDDYRAADGRLVGHAWPGGYPVVYYTEQGSTVCADCANDPDTSDPVTDGYISWEGPAETCDDCGRWLASAYGPVDDEPENPAFARYVTDAEYRSDAYWRQLRASIALDGARILTGAYALAYATDGGYGIPSSRWAIQMAAEDAYDARTAYQTWRDNRAADGRWR